MRQVADMTWAELIEECTNLEIRHLIEGDPKRALKMELRIDQLRGEMDRRRAGKAGTGGAS